MTEDDACVLRFCGRELRLPAGVWPALQFATTADEFAVEDLPDCLDAEGKLTLVTRLVREGVPPALLAPLRNNPALTEGHQTSFTLSGPRWRLVCACFCACSAPVSPDPGSRRGTGGAGKRTAETLQYVFVRVRIMSQVDGVQRPEPGHRWSLHRCTMFYEKGSRHGDVSADGAIDVARAVSSKPRSSAAPHGGGDVEATSKRSRTSCSHGTFAQTATNSDPGIPSPEQRPSRVRRLCRRHQIADGLRRSDRGRPRGDEDVCGTDAGDLVARRFARRVRRPSARKITRSGHWVRPPARSRAIVNSGDARVDYPRVLPDDTVTALRHRVAAVPAWVAYAPGLDDGTFTRRPRRGVGRACALCRRTLCRVPSRSRTDARPWPSRCSRIGRDTHARRRPPARMGHARGVVPRSGRALYLAASSIDELIFCRHGACHWTAARPNELVHDGRDVLAVTQLANGRVALSE